MCTYSIGLVIGLLFRLGPHILMVSLQLNVSLIAPCSTLGPRPDALDPSLDSIGPNTFVSPAGGQWTVEMAETAKAMYLATLQRSMPVANDNEYGQDDMLLSVNRYMDGARYGEQYGDQLEESDVDPNLDDDLVEIKHGSPLRKRRLEEIDKDEKGCKKRRRFRI